MADEMVNGDGYVSSDSEFYGKFQFLQLPNADIYILPMPLHIHNMQALLELIVYSPLVLGYDILCLFKRY